MAEQRFRKRKECAQSGIPVPDWAQKKKRGGKKKDNKEAVDNEAVDTKAVDKEKDNKEKDKEA
eukprot:5329610-Amphidinium_carterae.1